MWHKLSNWAKTLIVLCTAMLFMAIPFTRHLLLFILPLGSGVDDLIFFVLLFLAVTVFLIKAAGTEKVKNWLIKWFSK